MPLASGNVANELAIICASTGCPYLTDYFNKLYLFKIEYDIYQKYLKP